MTSYQDQPVTALKRRFKASLGSENLLYSSVPIWYRSEDLLHGIISDAFSQTVFDDSLTELVVEAWRKLKTIYVDNEVYGEAVERCFDLLVALQAKKQPLPPELVLDYAELSSFITGADPIRIAGSIDKLILEMKVSASSPTLVRGHLLRAECFRQTNVPLEKNQDYPSEYRLATSHANRCPRGTNLAVARIFLAQAKSDLINGYANDSLACIAQAWTNLIRAKTDGDGSDYERQSFGIELCRAEAAGFASKGGRYKAITSLSFLLSKSNTEDQTHNDEYCMIREDLALLHLANGDYRTAASTLIDNLHQAHSEAMQRRAAHMVLITCNAVGDPTPIVTVLRKFSSSLPPGPLSILRRAADVAFLESPDCPCNEEMERVLKAANQCRERSELFALCLEGIAWSSFIYFLDPAELREYLFKIQELADSLSAKDKYFLKTLLDIHVTALMEPPEENIPSKSWLASEEDMLAKADDRLTRLFGDQSFFRDRIALERFRMFFGTGQFQRASDSLLGFSKFETLGSYPPHSGLQSKMTELTQAVNRAVNGER